MGRSPSFEKYCGLKKKGKWTSEEDQKLVAYIEKHGHGSWSDLPDKAGLQRCGKSCRMRWINYLRPDVKRGKFSLQEEQTIIQLHALLGNRWSIIASHLSKRTDNEIKNYWNTHLKKRLTKLGINPMTHRPKTNLLGSAVDQSKDATNLSHMAQWESARLEAEARLGRESKKSLKKNLHHHNNPIGSTSAQLTATKKTSTMPRAKPQCLDVLKAWQGVVSGMFYFQTKADDNLDSPNSILNFSKNMAKNQNAVGLGNNTVGNQPIAMSHSVEERIFKENLLVDNPISLFQEITLTDGALLQESYNTKAENIVEGLSDIFAFDSSGERNLSISALDPDGLIDQDNNYWDVAMVDLVDISSGALSPIY